MTTAEKQKALRLLAKKRQRTRWTGYKGIGDYKNGAYECDYVSPYTKSAGNVNANIFIMLQDWSSDAALSEPVKADLVQLGFGERLATNRNLIKFLAHHFSVRLEDTFATNLFPFVKPGQMSRPIPTKDLVRAAKEFGIPQIEIVRPRLVICLGHNTFNAIRAGSDLEVIKPIALAIRSPFAIGKSRIWCQAHTGARGQNNRNKERQRVPNDWAAMQKDYGK